MIICFLRIVKVRPLRRKPFQKCPICLDVCGVVAVDVTDFPRITAIYLVKFFGRLIPLGVALDVLELLFELDGSAQFQNPLDKGVLEQKEQGAQSVKYLLRLNKRRAYQRQQKVQQRCQGELHPSFSIQSININFLTKQLKEIDVYFF